MRSADTEDACLPLSKHIPLDAVLRHLDPVEKPLWDCGPSLTERMVFDAYRDQRFEPSPAPADVSPSAEFIARRIAYFMHEGWTEPIDLRLFEHWPPTGGRRYSSDEYGFEVVVPDGRCRLYAAVLMGHEFLYVRITGDVELERKVFWACGADQIDVDEMIHVESSGSSVWVHAHDGSCVGRFDRELGMDVDVTVVAQLPAYAHLLNGGSKVFDPKEEWGIFRGLMQRHYGVVIPADLIRPSQVIRMRAGA